MTTDKNDPWELLREVQADRNHTTQCEREGDDGECVRCDIDAALARHDAMKSEDHNVKWEERATNRYGVRPHDADYSDDIFLTVEPHWLAQDRWLWRVEYVGEAKNEAEAKAAAIEYAGRLP
jgi:hypothetical protein